MALLAGAKMFTFNLILCYNIIMLVYGSKLKDKRVLSLHLGASIGRVTQTIVDPNILQIIAFRVEGPNLRGGILPVKSVREYSSMGMIIDSIDDIANEDEIIHVKEILELNFSLIDLKVVTRKKSKLGKVIDFTVDSEAWAVQQLIVQRPMIKSLIDPQLTIPRSEIVEVDDYQVIVKDEERKIKEQKPADFTPNFVNPFRDPELATEAKTLDEK